MLRPELSPPRLTSGALVAQLRRAYDRIDAGEPPATVAEDFERESGVPTDPGTLLVWCGSEDPEDVVIDLLMPPRHVLAKHQLTREELIEVAARFLSNIDRYDEKNEKWWQALFDANVRAPAGHVQYERTVARTRMPTPEEVTDAALSYEPFEMGPPSLPI
jgi:hypothetical protein